MEEQAQAIVIIWRHDRYIPTAMLPRVHQLREEASEKSLLAYHPAAGGLRVLFRIVALFITRFL
jgi:hypothetical protein